jgi:hypothetical protein
MISDKEEIRLKISQDQGAIVVFVHYRFGLDHHQLHVQQSHVTANFFCDSLERDQVAHPSRQRYVFRIHRATISCL